MSEVKISQETPANHNKKMLWEGIVAATPIIIGYVPISITFGMLGGQSGISLYHTLLMSILVFAGASQFVGINMMLAGAASTTIILTTLVLNLRHMIMSMSLMNKINFLPVSMKAILSFGITDETFAVASLKDRNSGWFLSGLIFASYITWVLGTLIGGLLANFIPPSISSIMGISLYAMFIGLLIPAIRNSWKLILIVIPSALLSYFFSLFLNDGWSIVLATILGSALGIFIKIEED
ncbi:AzlC family ABC transporter permease [Pseudogracilibacillus sp. SO30301A]|uniref:AzlC family ABC transporter permease n=1 Tax=Pseudogracilibacillus sp. SO30301A TaxID=3098291 RepID=UPI00300E35CC